MAEKENVGIFSWRRLCANGAAIGRAVASYLGHTTLPEELSPKSPNSTAVTVPRSTHCACCAADAAEDAVYQFDGRERLLPFLTYTRLESAEVRALVGRITGSKAQNRFVADENSGSDSEPERDRLGEKDLVKIQRRIFVKIRALEKRKRHANKGMTNRKEESRLIVAFGRSERACVKDDLYRRVMAWEALPKNVKPRERTAYYRRREGPRARRQEQSGLMKSSVQYRFVDAVGEGSGDSDDSSGSGMEWLPGERDTEDLALLIQECREERAALTLYPNAEDVLTFSYTHPWVHRLKGKHESGQPVKNCQPVAASAKKTDTVMEAFGKCGKAHETAGRCTMSAFRPRKTFTGNTGSMAERAAALQMENKKYGSAVIRDVPHVAPQDGSLEIHPARPSSSRGATPRTPRIAKRDAPRDETNVKPEGDARDDAGAIRPVVSKKAPPRSFRTACSMPPAVVRAKALESEKSVPLCVPTSTSPSNVVGVLANDGPFFGEKCVPQGNTYIPYITAPCLRNLESFAWTSPEYQMPPNSPRPERENLSGIAIIGAEGDLRHLEPKGQDDDSSAASRGIPSILEEDADTKVRERRPASSRGSRRPSISNNADSSQRSPSRLSARRPSSRRHAGEEDRMNTDLMPLSPEHRPTTPGSRVRGATRNTEEGKEGLGAVGRRLIGKDEEDGGSNRRDSFGYYSTWRKQG